MTTVTPRTPAEAAASAAPFLVTGFEPFGGDPRNPSAELVQALHGGQVAGVPVVGEVLPCRFDTAPVALRRALRRHRPRAVLALGLAASRSAIGLERVAVNWIDARIPDNGGLQPVDVPVRAGGPAALFTRLPVKALAARLEAAGLPVELSWSAGSFVCNQLFYVLLDALRRRPAVPAGFVHLPPLPGQAGGGRPLPLPAQQHAVALLLQALAEGVAEVTTPGGRED